MTRASPVPFVLSPVVLALSSVVLSACGPPVPTHAGEAGLGKEASAPVAAPPPELLSKYEQMVVRPCGSRCLFRRRGVSRIQLDISPHGVATATDRGSHTESFRWAGGEKEIRTEWERGWDGSWSEGDGVLTVDLAPTDFRCVHNATRAEGDHECEPRPLRLHCEMQDVPLVKRRKARRESTPAWVCTTRRYQDDSAQTPFPWVFGVEAALVSRDRGSMDAPERAYKYARPNPPP
jgi:hypothetical protein